jgi:hypothetical protein
VHSRLATDRRTMPAGVLDAPCCSNDSLADWLNSTRDDEVELPSKGLLCGFFRRKSRKAASTAAPQLQRNIEASILLKVSWTAAVDANAHPAALLLICRLCMRCASERQHAEGFLALCRLLQLRSRATVDTTPSPSQLPRTTTR